MKETIELKKNLGCRSCKTHEKDERPLSAAYIKGYLTKLPDWKLYGKEILRVYTFKNFYETMGFVNAAAYIANQENHHPDLEVGYDTCKMRYSSHDIGGLSENDFICATKIDELFCGVS